MDVGLIKQLTDANTATLRTLYGEPVAYEDPDAVGANPVAVKYGDGTIVGSTDNGSYVKYPTGLLSFEVKPVIDFGVDSSVNQTATAPIQAVTATCTGRSIIKVSGTEVNNNVYSAVTAGLMIYVLNNTSTITFVNGSGETLVATSGAYATFRFTGRWK